MKAIILAAGQGTRLRPLTDAQPKCLVKLAGVSLLDRQLAVLQRAGIHDIVVMGGYCAEQLSRPGVRVRINPAYAATNMVATLFVAEDEFNGVDDVLIAYGDIVYESAVLRAVLEQTAPLSMVVDMQWQRLWKLRMEDPLNDAETLKLDASGYVSEVGNKPFALSDIQGQYIGLIRVNAAAHAAWKAAYAALLSERGAAGIASMFMTSFLQYIIDHGGRLKATPIHGGWIEVDTVEDLDTYEAHLASGSMQEIYQPDA